MDHKASVKTEPATSVTTMQTSLQPMDEKAPSASLPTHHQAPGLFAQAVFMIAWHRHFSTSIDSQDKISNILPFITKFLDDETQGLDVEGFQQSKTFTLYFR